MPLEHHFVVIVKDGVIGIDYDSTDHKFYDGSVWNTDTEEWETTYDNASDYETAHELLQNAIMASWKENA